MDLIVGHLKQGDFPTCVFCEDYNACIISNRHFASVYGEEIQVLAVFLGKGSMAPEINAALQRQLRYRSIGWYQSTPGEIVDVVHFLTCPQSPANTWSRSTEKQIAPLSNQSNVPAATANQASGNEPKPGRKPRVRVRKQPAEPVHSA